MSQIILEDVPEKYLERFGPGTVVSFETFLSELDDDDSGWDYEAADDPFDEDE